MTELAFEPVWSMFKAHAYVRNNIATFKHDYPFVIFTVTHT